MYRTLGASNTPLCGIGVSVDLRPRHVAGLKSLLEMDPVVPFYGVATFIGQVGNPRLVLPGIVEEEVFSGTFIAKHVGDEWIKIDNHIVCRVLEINVSNERLPLTFRQPTGCFQVAVAYVQTLEYPDLISIAFTEFIVLGSQHQK